MYADCRFIGPLLVPGFTTHALPALLRSRGLFLDTTDSAWRVVQRGLLACGSAGGPIRVLHHIVNPLAAALGFGEVRREESLATREGVEEAGHLLLRPNGPPLRIWAIGSGASPEPSPKRGVAMRIDPVRRANRILRARGECTGLLTNGETLRLLFCDPRGSDSHMAVTLIGRSGWVSQFKAPESYRLIAALTSVRGSAAMADIFDAARLHQTAVTKTLRLQSRAAIESFLQCVLDQNCNTLLPPNPGLLWRQALVIVYRLLFILKLESSLEPGAGFTFAASESWRQGFSPNRALGPLVRRHLDLGHDTGRLLEDGLRTLFQICREGLDHSSLSIAPLGGGLFDSAATRAIDGMAWGERAVALLLDRLLWTVPRGRERERVHYGSLDVEELGRVYELLLDLEPDIALAPMVRTWRGRVAAVVPATLLIDNGASKTEDIPPGRFFLRSGLGRRTGGSYYTPHDLVRHMVQHALTPLVAASIKAGDPSAILRIKVFDPAMGSGHFLVEACRFLADALYDVCCRCDASNTEASRRAIEALPDLDRRLWSYLPSHSHDRSDAGPSRARALAICRRLVVVHCIYGVDCDPLAVELAKLSLWLESFAEGLPLTFLDHRLIAGDSIAGPFFRDLEHLPVGGGDLDPLLALGVTARLRDLIDSAIGEARKLEASIGTNIADIIAKQVAKNTSDRLMSPLRSLAQAWSGAVKGKAREANDAWVALARSVSETGAWPGTPHPHQIALMENGEGSLPLDLIFPEVFRPDQGIGGFQAVLGNPPWDVIHYQTKEYLAGFDPRVMDAPTKRERGAIERRLLEDPVIKKGFELYKRAFIERKNLCERLFPRFGSTGSIDMFQVFAERMLDCVAPGGVIGLIGPSSFHANEGTTRLRRRFLEETSIETCFTFENRKKLFDIHGRQKFTVITARKTGPTTTFRCAFYLDSIGQLSDPDRIMHYDRDFITATGGECETFLELRGRDDLRVARHMFVSRPNLKDWMLAQCITFGREAHMTDDSHRFIPVTGAPAGEALPLHEGKTFHQYSDRWKAGPRYAIRLDAMRDKPGWVRAANHYRLAFREISRSTDERTMIAAVVPPGYVFGHKGTCERTPWVRPDATALILCAIFNSFAFDWCVRQKIAASVSLFMLNGCPVPLLTNDAARFLAHGALRLSCRHAGYARLWREQMGTAHAFPVDLPTDGGREPLRAAIDAVVARAYGLERDDYHHILAAFSHKVQPSAPELCRAAFDVLMKRGAKPFYKRYDPFMAVPVPEKLSQPDSASPIASATLIPSIAAESIPPA